MDLEFKHLSVNALYWQASFFFYSNLLGFDITQNDERWALLGGSDDGRLSFQLNSGGWFPGYRIWGHYQGVRPSIQVENLDAVAERIRRNRVIFRGASVEETSWGRRIEFSAPEMIRWTLSEVPGEPMSDDLRQPVIGHVEIKVNNLAAQAGFYRDVLGFELKSETFAEVILSQGPGKPWLVLEAGGGKQENPATFAKQPDRAHPVVMGLVTRDIRAISDRARTAGSTILLDLGQLRETGLENGATGLILADPDGNAIKIWQSS